jgi:tripartite-type tricarboxylate transporter receptor subunit TctC
MASMRWQRRHLLAAAAATVAGLAPLRGFCEEPFPTQPVKLVVTFGAGGIADLVTRLVGARLSLELGRAVVVENRPGASGAIGAHYVAQARADGYTLLVGTPSTQVINPMIFDRLPYDPWKDFTPVSLMTEAPLALVVRANSPWVDLQDLVRHARAHPGALTFSSAGAGTTPHLGMELFKLVTGTSLVHVPYKSGAEAMMALVAGHVDVLIEAGAVIASQVRSGQLKPLVAPGPRRSAALPGLETTAEQGSAEFQVTAPWAGIAAPTGTPGPRIAILAAAISRAMADSDLRSRLLERGIEPLPSGPEAYAELLRREQQDWLPVVKAAGIFVK